MKEINSELRLKRSVEGMGGRCFKLKFPGTAGAPDRLVLLPGGGVYFVEMKKTDGKLEPSQRITFPLIEKLGTRVYVLYGHEGVDEFINAVKAESKRHENTH